MRMRVLPTPTVTGPKRVRVGPTVFRVPAGAGIVRAHENLVYVLSAGQIHALCARGEVEIPLDLRAPLREYYFEGRRR
jgi:hypothetical protein